jgi:hypothetical protein
LKSKERGRGKVRDGRWLKERNVRDRRWVRETIGMIRTEMMEIV